MTTPRQDAIEAIYRAINECGCQPDGPCSLCEELATATELLEGDDIIPPDGWAVAGEQTMHPGVVLRARPGDRIVTLRRLR